MFGVPTAALCAYCLYRTCRSHTAEQAIPAPAKKSKLFWIFAVLLVWAVLSGVGGLDILCLLMRYRDYFPGLWDALRGAVSGTFLMEYYLIYFSSAGNTFLLFWNYNQIIPFWIVFMLMLLQKKGKSALFLHSLLLLYAPFAAAALLPGAVYLAVRQKGLSIRKPLEALGRMVKQAFSVENATGVVLLLVFALFYKSNVSAGQVALRELTPKVLLFLAAFFITEFGLYMLWLYPDYKKNVLFYLLLCSTAASGFLVMGGDSDFAWRASIPFAFYLMLLILRKLDAGMPKGILWRKLLIVGLLVLGSLGACAEIARTVYRTAEALNSH